VNVQHITQTLEYVQIEQNKHLYNTYRPELLKFPNPNWSVINFFLV